MVLQGVVLQGVVVPISKKVFNKAKYKSRRQALRNDATDAERVLWQQLRHKQLGVKFRRQHSMGEYIVDFYCPAAKLVIECDGSQHFEADAIGYDNERTVYLNALGMTVRRYHNRQILTQIDAVIEDIMQYLAGETPP